MSLGQDCNQIQTFQDSNRNTIIMKPLNEYQKEEDESLSLQSYGLFNCKRQGPKANWFKVNSIVQQFRQKMMKRSSNVRKLQQLLYKHFFLERYVKDIQNQKLISFAGFNFKAISPGNNLLFIWDVLKTILVAVIFFLLPLQRSFDIHQLDDLSTYCLLYLLLDVTLKLNTAYLKQGNIISSRTLIIKNYLRTDFMLDIAIAVCFMSKNFSLEAALLLKLNIYLNELQNQLTLSSLVREISNLIKLTIQITSFLHLISCVWWYIGKQSEYLGNSWIIDQNILDSNPFVQYCYAYYWATISMVTVGYGDITPTNYLEMIFCIIISLLASGLFAYSINQIGQILTSINESKSKLVHTIRRVNNYMKQHDIPQTLQIQIRNYLEFIIKQQQDNEIENIQSITSTLSQQLRNELMYQVFMNIIQDCKIITHHFSDATLKNMALKTQAVQFCPGELVFKQGVIDDSSIYFVLSGSVSMLENDRVLRTCSKGSCFGIQGFFTQNPRKCTAISQEFTKAYKIDFKTFQNIASQEDFQKFCEIKEQIIYRMPVVGVDCMVCRQNDHFVSECPLGKYQPDREAVILRANFNVAQMRRRKEKARKMAQFSALADRSYIQRRLDILHQNLLEQWNCKTNSDLSNLSNLVSGLDHSFRQEGTQNQAEAKHEHFLEPPQIQEDRTSLQIISPNKPEEKIYHEQIEIDKQMTYLNYRPHQNLASVIQGYNKVRHLVARIPQSGGYHLIRHKWVKQNKRMRKKLFMSLAPI